MNLSALALVAGFTIALSKPGFGEDEKAANVALKIVKTVPAAWATEVPAETPELSIIFNAPIWLGSTAYLGRSSIAPTITGDPKVSADKRTFSIPVHLDPGKVYFLAINERAVPGVGFQDADGRSAAPFNLVFQTAGKAAEADKPPKIEEIRIGLTEPGKTVFYVKFDRKMDATSNGFTLVDAGGQPASGNEKAVYNAKKLTWSLTVDGTAKPVALWLNHPQFLGFRSTTRIPAWPRQVVLPSLENLPPGGKSARVD